MMVVMCEEGTGAAVAVWILIQRVYYPFHSGWQRFKLSSAFFFFPKFIIPPLVKAFGLAAYGNKGIQGEDLPFKQGYGPNGSREGENLMRQRKFRTQ